MSEHERFAFHTLDELRQRIAALGLELQTTEELQPLFEPLRVGPLTLPNRLAVLPMEGCDGRADGAPDELTIRRYRRFAGGGAGVLWFEATAVVPEGRANPRQLWLHPGTVNAFAELVQTTLQTARERCGESHRPLTVVQLTHSGRYSRPVRAPQPIIAHRSPFLDPVHKLPPDYPLITDDALERLEDQYVAAARLAHQAGFDAVDIKACHRYLVSELHASFTREGRYGGSFENRTRFFRNIVNKIRAAVPDLIVTTRLNAFDAMAYPYGFGVDPTDSNQPDLTEPIELVRFLQDAGAPLVNITIGNPYFNPHVNRPFDAPVIHGAKPPESPLAGVDRIVQITRQIQAAFPDLPVLGGGYSWLRQFFPHVAAAHVQAKWVSLVGIGRMAFAYSDCVRELQTQGRLDPKKVCVACSACTQIMRDGGRSGCVLRDAPVYGPIYKAGRAQAPDTIKQLAETCQQCLEPTCVEGCPARVTIPEFVHHLAQGEFRAAYETLRQSNPLATVCGFVCPAEVQCESRCINEHYAQAVPIRELQRWVSQKALDEGWAAAPRLPAAESGKRVAVLGGGPAGIAAAAKLAELGHRVTLLHQTAQLGGAAQETIPQDRLPDDILQREVDAVLQSYGDRIQRQHARIDSDHDLDWLIRQGFDAVLIALGLSQSTALPKATPPRTGVIGALEFLRRSKQGESVSGTVYVLGGGNTAIDAALSAQPAGARDVFLVYRRSFAEMPAWPEARDRAIRAGVHLLTLTAPVAYVADAAGELTGLRVVRTQLGAAGPDGRRTPIPLAGTEHVLPASLVIEALGQEMPAHLERALSGLRFTDPGLIWVDPDTLETSRAGVFAAGDIVNGGATVVQAVAEGTRAVVAIHRFLT